MTPHEFEQYVSQIIQQLALAENARVSTNRRFAGKRQSGEYEIDIAVEFRLAELLDILIIVECKNWKRPVDRPVIQKIAQTRDAISAHKAAVVSPVGFTKEAVDVSRNLGVALWVLSFAEKLPTPMLYRLTGEQTRAIQSELEAFLRRKKMLPLVEFCLPDNTGDIFSLVNFSDVTHYDDPRSRKVIFDRIRSKLKQQQSPEHDAISGEIAFSHHCLESCFTSGQVGIDPRTATAQIVDILFGGLGAIMKAKEQMRKTTDDTSK